MLALRLRERERVFGGWTSLGHPGITEILAASHVDFIGIDLEHSTITLAQAQAIITASQAAGVPCLPRLASHNGEQVKRLLDAGADGIIVPDVAEPAQVEQLIRWLKYPPEGQRHFGVARAHGYGFAFDDYVNQWNQRAVLIIQVESIEAVDNVERSI